jgi:hypothetical protein
MSLDPLSRVTLSGMEYGLTGKAYVAASKSDLVRTTFYYRQT